MTQFELPHDIIQAFELFLTKDVTDAQRIFHGRGGCYPGLEWCSIDAFQPVVVVTLFRDPPDGFLSELMAFFNSKFEGGDVYTHLVVQHRYKREAEFEWLVGSPLDQGQAQRGQLKFAIRYMHKNLGYFLDMEPGRRWVEQRVKGKSVLNLFAYTCAFSVVAQYAGAKNIVNVDMSRGALGQGRDNHRLNKMSCESIQFLPLDILKSWSRIRKRGPYDVIVIDPPTYQKGSFVAQKDYVKVIKRIHEFAAEGAEILACLNAPELGTEFLKDLFTEFSAGCQFQERLPMDDVFCDRNPEKQLKLLHYRYGPLTP